MPADKIEKLEPVYKKMLEMTKGCYPVPDNRGPLVYEVTEDPSLNGIIPLDDCDCESEETEEDS